MAAEMIEVIRKTARKIENSSSYQWGHMGLCNCGFLAQEITSISKEEIHRRAMQRYGDWSEQLNDYCPTSGLIAFGFTRTELAHLEKLSDPAVLRLLPIAKRNLHHNIKADVVLYMNTWAQLLEDSYLKMISIQDLAVKELQGSL
jgi:hypothetical protein